MKFQQYLNENASDMEQLLVWTIKGVHQNPIALSIIDYLKKENYKAEKAVHLGSGSYPITKKWQYYGGNNTTPKTDVIIDDFPISMKKKGGSQLMSGAGGETRATILVALEHTPMLLEILLNELDETLNRFIKIKSEHNITQMRKLGNTDIIKKAESVHKKFRNLLEERIHNNKEFKTMLVHEAMTGNNKFGKNSIAAASNVLVWDPNGVNHKIHYISKSYAKKLSNNININIGFKSTRGGNSKYTIYSVLRILIKETQKISNIPMITENEMWNKIKAMFIKIWNNVLSWLKKSVINILNFLQLDIGNVNISNTVF